MLARFLVLVTVLFDCSIDSASRPARLLSLVCSRDCGPRRLPPLLVSSASTSRLLLLPLILPLLLSLLLRFSRLDDADNALGDNGGGSDTDDADDAGDAGEGVGG